MQTKPKNEFEILDDYELEGHSDYSEELVRLSHNKKTSFSYSYYDGYKNFCRAENLSDHLGNLFGKRSAQYQMLNICISLGNLKMILILYLTRFTTAFCFLMKIE